MKRPPGRPPLDAKSASPSADVHVTLSAADFDKAEKHAKARRESLQDFIRRSLKHLLNDERG
jgi:hypothetical protein